MKKLNMEQACEILKDGKIVMVKISSRDDFVSVSSEDKLESLERLYKFKANDCFEIYLPKEAKVPKDTMKVSLEEALELVAKGELVYGVEDNSEEEEINNSKALMQFYRRALFKGTPVLIWKP